jgi:hypothetical protein
MNLNQGDTIAVNETDVTNLAEFEQMLGFLRAMLADKRSGGDLSQEEFNVLKTFFNTDTILLAVNKILDDGVHELRCCETNKDDELPLNLCTH